MLCCIVEICCELDGIVLVIELVVVWVFFLGFVGVCVCLCELLCILGGGV